MYVRVQRYEEYLTYAKKESFFSQKNPPLRLGSGGNLLSDNIRRKKQTFI